MIAAGQVPAAAREAVAPVLRVEGLTVTMAGRRRVPWRPPSRVTAVTGADLQLDAGSTLGLVGESGSGKSTTARAILRLLRADAGRIEVAGFRVDEFGRRAPTAYRRAVQAVFQDPLGSLDQTMTIGNILAEPLAVHSIARGRAAVDRVADLLDQVGLAAHHLRRYPYELSGGQRQRVAIAKALAVEPRLIILDEPVSALDVSVQSQVVNLLEDVQERTGVAYLFIAHDLAVVRHTSERIAVMYRSRIVEEGPADRVCEQPAHPYTQALLAAAPDPDPARQREQRRRRRELDIVPVGPAPDATRGCPFAARCPHRMAVCERSFPDWSPVEGGGRVACHLAIDATTLQRNR
ncbi:oligopeptide/dipeptide ABC transporter ATP-binding protein [Pseudonocardia kunmingensis]|uniref:Peptide/nickel transport system ATP-binding protein/oligopeptide transport system ATP-binding protein n=1 Tax=Pseudonocardia kunmingensis TaxID=630975 RepID=A0A543DPT3_9PSEU|nr:oligopeptide/dipeptide ABC transporter ATP-binding protein [Pseudonocardia kunmingensis]TQM11329.1 peptide/nickel transport system ATP-binding protein/oligopeptide transport system ATP-binding protein [Pseudonocardia kunmingensis]